MWMYLLAIFLAMHGLIHFFYISPPQVDPQYPFDVDKSWLITRLRLSSPFVHALGYGLTVATILAFSLSAITAVGFVAPTTWWRSATLFAASISAAQLLLFWNKRLWPGVAIDLALLVALLWLGWQPVGVIVG